MKKIILSIFLILCTLPFCSNFGMGPDISFGTPPGPNDLYAWQIFGTQDPTEVMIIHTKLFDAFDHGVYRGIPDAEAIYRIVRNAQMAIWVMGLPNAVVHNSKEIFNKYIKPLIDQIKREPEQPQYPKQPQFDSFPPSISNDLYAWQIFGTKDPKEITKVYKKLALKFHPDRYREPNAEEIFKLISTAYSAKDTFEGIFTIMRDAKPIFIRYIKPYLDIEPQTKSDPRKKIFEEITNRINNARVKLSTLEKQLFELKKNFSLQNPFALLRKAETLKDESDKLWIQINSLLKIPGLEQLPQDQVNFALENRESILNEISTKSENLIIITSLLELFIPIFFIEELIKGIRETQRAIQSVNLLNHAPNDKYSATMGEEAYIEFLREIIGKDAVTSNGKIKSLEHLYNLILNYLDKIKQSEYFNDIDLKIKQSFLRHIRKYRSKLTAQSSMMLPTLSSTLETLAHLPR